MDDAPVAEFAPLRPAVRIAAFVGAVSLVVEFGWPVSTATLGVLHILDYGIAALFLADIILRFAFTRDRRGFLRRHPLEFALAIALGIETALMFAVTGGTALLRLYLAGFQLYLVASLLLALARAQDRLTNRLNPAVLPLGSFLLLILAGAGLLMAPNCRAPGAAPWSFVDALFTSTSASCVTGLSVRDIGSELSFRGQLALLGLIQLGGLGPVLLGVFLLMLQGSRLHARQQTLLRDLMGSPFLGNLGGFVKMVVVITLGVEAAGAAFLYFGSPDGPVAGRAWWSVFHSVSAFCNAGFGLHADSLTGFAGSPLVCLTVAGLVVVGGIGFPVLMDLGLWCRRTKPGVSPARLSLHTKIVLLGTALALVAGAVLFWVAERDGVLAGLSHRDAAVASAFQSAMPRTAGFNTVSTAALQLPTLLLVMFLMIVGAGPVSTGGGVKVATVGVLWVTTWSVLRNRDSSEAFRRRIAPAAVRTSIAILTLYSLAVLAVTGALVMTQHGIPFQSLLFESISALSTVGLSTGVTAQLDTAGRLILCAAMFFGRLGPLALVGSIVFRPAPLRYQYPEEPVTVS
ncbi:MAG: hypothetical protein HYY18_18215 [Planctomycetes bacterium]|nr:hypothetical protein [Planctomycetota bacterium]